MKKNALPPALVSNLQDVLQRRKGGDAGEGGNEDQQDKSNKDDSTEPSSSNSGEIPEPDSSKPIVLVTNADGIDSPGLACLLDALVRQGLYNVYFCVPQLDKSVSGHSVTLRETVAVSSTEIQGAPGYDVSGTPVDCISLVLSGALYSWSKPLLVITGINRGTSCGHHAFYSGVVAGAREALLSGIPSISISLNWKKDESQESDFKDAASVCLPLITAAIRDIEKGAFPKRCLMNVEVPTSPLANKGFKLTKQSLWKSTLSWNAIPANRNPAAGRFLSNHQSLGIQLAQLGRDASAAGAARRLATQKKDIEEVESVGVSGKSDPNRKVKYFRLELLDKPIVDKDEDLDFRALENGFVAVTPLSVSMHTEPEVQTAVSDWISAAL
nr:5'-nucleotidase SurE-like [Ipomoea batatas]GMC76015.1 5'-nucleotidase SurE-like [Ipomoea batatas]GMC77447.1 5'-nucleotidase SurE-like [Ipomoea batatas]GME02272.1 5'-nucleotidase SurE-like [Ipomoea batatas]